MPLLTELVLFWVWVLQRCRAYGAGCDLTARVLKQGLDVLGIETVEQM
jgi:hypothetical protein